jgi:hypothetical protein
MDVASLCPLPVGIVPWASPEPTCTVVIKATFALDRDGDARLADEQDPLSIDRPSAIDADELESATDFAPLKARADILLVGHASAELPTTAIAALLRVDGLTRRFFALAGAPSTQIPLSSLYLRAAGAESEEVVRVGPEAPWSAGRQARLGHRALGGDGLPLGPLRGFDFGFFNAAPADQQVELLRVGATLLLRGLLPGVERREVRLPGLRPVVFLMRRATNGRGSTGEIALRCDTLLIDTDRAVCSLTWRGVFEPPDEDEAACLLVDVAYPGDKPTFRELHRKLSRAAAAEAARTIPGPQAAPAASAVEEVEEIEVEEDDEIVAEDEPTGRHRAVPDPRALGGAGFRLGSPLGAAPIRASQVDPFELQPDRERPEPPTQQVIEETIRLSGPELDAAFELAEQEAAAAPVTAPMARRTSTLSDTASGNDRPLGAALPFRAAPVVLSASPLLSPPPSFAGQGERDPRSDTQVGLDAPRPQALPFATRAWSGSEHALSPMMAPEIAPEIAAPVTPPTALVDAAAPISLERFAQIKVELREGTEARAAVLGRHGLDEIAWTVEERRRAEELSADARAGKQDRVLALHAALRAAGERMGVEAEEMPIEDYVALRAAIEGSEDPAAVLAESGWQAASFRRIHRAMTRRALADPGFERALREQLVDARRNR